MGRPGARARARDARSALISRRRVLIESMWMSQIWMNVGAERPGCFFLCGTLEARRTGLAALPFDGGEGYHGPGGVGGLVCPVAPPPGPKKRKVGDGAVTQAATAWFGDSQPRTNCCPHGTTFDFNDNVLPFVVAMFLKLAEDRLCQAGNGFMDAYVDDGSVAAFCA